PAACGQDGAVLPDLRHQHGRPPISLNAVPAPVAPSRRNNPSLPPFVDERNGRLPVPSSLQYPVERHRYLQRKWNRLLQRTAASKEGHPSGTLTSLRVSASNRCTRSSASSKR